MRLHKLHKMILSMLLLLLISIPVVAYAQSVKINGTPVSNPFTGPVGGFQIDSLQVVAVPGTPNVLSFTAAQITNTGTASAILTIQYQHTFSFSPIDPSSTVQRFHGASMDGSFFQFDPLDLAKVVSGDKITKVSEVAYDCIDGCFFTTYSEASHSYTVPAPAPPPAPPVTVSDNSFGPQKPPQISGSLFTFCGSTSCPEVLRSTVTITLGPGESLGLTGSLKDVAASTALVRDNTLKTFGNTRFAEFFPRVEIDLGHRANHDEFEVKAFLRLAPTSSGINPPTEDVRLCIRNFCRTIGAGSFKKDRHGRFKFKGVIDGVKLEAQIRPFGPTSFEFSAEGERANLTGFSRKNPVVPVKLVIGNDYGVATVRARFD
jgi:hypothetical protein